MRREPTEAERLLWKHLRGKRLSTHKFRRQEQIGDYIVDFVCFQARLIVEVDGGQHSENLADDARNAWLEKQGFAVVRFWNNDVLENIDGVLMTIATALASPPTPTSPSEQARKASYPLPQGERSGSNSSPLAGEAK